MNDENEKNLDDETAVKALGFDEYTLEAISEFVSSLPVMQWAFNLFFKVGLAYGFVMSTAAKDGRIQYTIGDPANNAAFVSPWYSDEDDAQSLAYWILNHITLLISMRERLAKAEAEANKANEAKQ